MNDNFEILDEYDFMIAGKLNELNLDRSGLEEAKVKNINILLENKWNQIGDFLFYISCEKQSLKKVNIWIDSRTGIQASQEVIREEVKKYYLDKGYSQYKSGFLLYKWESKENYNPSRIWLDCNTGQPPLLCPMDAGEGDYIGSKDIEDQLSERDGLLSEVKLRKRTQQINYESSEDEYIQEVSICDKFLYYIKCLFE